MQDILTEAIAAVLILIRYEGYPLIFLLMMVESSYIPVPSEIIMPFSGYLASVPSSHLDLWLVILAGIAGTVAGSYLGYMIAFLLGEDRTTSALSVVIRKHELERSKQFFRKYGLYAVLAGRVLPGIRTYIAFPAGIYRMDVKRYLAYSAAGTTPWCIFLAVAGYYLGSSWGAILSTPFHYILYAAVAILIILFIYYLRR